MMTGAQAQQMRIKRSLNQTKYWSVVGIGQSGGSRYESGATPVPHSIEMLLTIAYGTESQSDRIVRQLRGGK